MLASAHPGRGPSLALASLLAIAAACFTPDTAHAQHRPVGLGVILGDPTALTLKLRLDRSSAVQFHAGWGFREDSGSRVVLIADYLYHFGTILPETGSAGSLSPYLGIGGKLGIAAGKKNDGLLLGARVPLGLSFLIRGTPLEVFLEVAVGIHLIPETSALVDGGLGIRFYF